MKKKVSVVILNWNGENLLQQFLPYLLTHTDQNLAEIVVADNKSTDNSISFIETNYPSIKLIQLDQNYGFAEGYNIALQQIDTEYTVLLNSDVEVSSNWLEPLIEALDNDSTIGAVQPKIKAQKSKKYFEYAGASGGFIDYLGYPFCRGRIFDVVEEDVGQYNNPVEIFWTSGACMAIRTSLYYAVGGLDKTFFAHMEEIDLCWRLNARNYVLKCIPRSTVFHVGGATLAENSPRKTFLNFRNNLLMLYKNLPEKEFNKAFRIRKCLDYIAAIQMLLTGKRSNYKAVLKAHSEFKAIKHLYTDSRNQNLDRTINTEIKTIYLKSILWQFYIRRCRKFDQIKY